MIEFHDPRGEVQQAAEPYALSYDITDADADTTVALLANGFPDSENFLNRLGEALTARFAHLKVRVWNKGNASIPAPTQMLNEIKASCQVAIAAYGH